MFVPGTSAWNFGASIMTFLFPEILFVVVATTLYILYTRPEIVPGHWTPRGIERPVSYTAFPPAPQAAARQAAAAGQAATAGQAETAGQAVTIVDVVAVEVTTVDEEPADEDSSAAGTEDAE